MDKKQYQELTSNNSIMISKTALTNPEFSNQKWFVREIYYHKENFKTPKLDYCLSEKNFIKITPFFKDLTYHITGQN